MRHSPRDMRHPVPDFHVSSHFYSLISSGCQHGTDMDGWEVLKMYSVENASFCWSRDCYITMLKRSSSYRPSPSLEVEIRPYETGTLVSSGPLLPQNRGWNPNIWPSFDNHHASFGWEAEMRKQTIGENNEVEKERENVHGEPDCNNHWNQASGSCCSWLGIQSCLYFTCSSAKGGWCFEYCSSSGTNAAQWERKAWIFYAYRWNEGCLQRIRTELWAADWMVTDGAE